jgi:hypothetical protein
MLKHYDEVDVDSTIITERNKSTTHRIRRLATIAIGTLVFLVALLVALRYLCIPLLVYGYPTSGTYLLDTGIYGAYPYRQYTSTDLTSPQANVVQSDDSCDNGLVLLSIGGQSVPGSGPMILDMAGNLVWSAPGQYGEDTANTKIQIFQGHDYLTFWAGDKLQESGLGSYYMLNSSYNVVHTVSAVGEGLEGDLHEFKITEDGSALITVYERTSANLSSTNVVLPADQTIVDGILQDIDIATGELLFEWRASHHLSNPALQKSSGGVVADGSFDYFHMNSIDKDSKGNYLVSLRHIHALVYIDGPTGEILWTLAKDVGDFEDLSEGEATGFQWQHDARWISEEDGIISLFDNGIAHKHPDAAYSQGLIVQLDFVNWTATLLQSYTSTGLISSPSQGNVQLLEKADGPDHVFIGWGASAAFTEHSPNGDLLCETHFGASWLFYFERVKSYRAFKTFDWRATPTAWDPEAQIEDDNIYVSWNGATEVAYWSLQARTGATNAIQDSSAEDSTFTEIDTITKDADFEQHFTLPSADDNTTYRVAALDSQRNLLRYSNEVVYQHTSTTIWIWSTCLFIVSLLVVFALLYSRMGVFMNQWARRRESVKDFEYHALDHREPA